MIVFGKELNTPLSLLCENEDPDPKTNNKAYAVSIREHHKMVKEIIARARKHAARDFGYADQAYNRNVRGPFFKAGEYCYVLVDCPQHKFSKRWRGPYRIRDVINEHLYVVEMENEDKICNVSKLKHYRFNKFSPEDIPKFLTASTQTEDEPSPSSMDVTCESDIQSPPTDVLHPNVDSDNVRRSTRSVRTPNTFQAGFN